MADFKVTVDSETLTIDGLTFAPAEADNLKAAVSFAGSMRDALAFPPQIDYKQFVVQFFEDGRLIVKRAEGQAAGEIKFSFDTVDRLVVTITSTLEISVDRKRLSPSPRSVGDPGFHDQGDIIEG